MKELWPCLCSGAIKNLEKKENEVDFDFMDAFHEGEFCRTLRRLAPSGLEFNG